MLNNNDLPPCCYACYISNMKVPRICDKTIIITKTAIVANRCDELLIADGCPLKRTVVYQDDRQ